MRDDKKTPYLDAALQRMSLSVGMKAIALVGSLLNRGRRLMENPNGSPGDAKRRAKARARRQMASRSRSINRARERRLR